MNPNEMMNYLDHLLKMPEEESVPLINILIKEHNSIFFKVLHKMNTILPLVRKAADDDKYHLAAKLMLLGCNRHVVDGSRKPFDLLTDFQKEKVSLHYTIVWNERALSVKREKMERERNHF